MTLRLRPVHRPRIIWLLAILAFLFGCRMVAAMESALSSTATATEQLQRRIDANDRVIAQAGALRRREQLARRDFMRIYSEERPAILVAEFLLSLQDVARRSHLSIVSVTPADDTVAPQIKKSALLPLAVTVLIRGNFRAMVRFIQEITRQKPLTSLDSANIALSPDVSTHGGELAATIHLTLYRVLLHFTDVSAD